MDGGCVRGVGRPIVSPVVRGVVGTSGPQPITPASVSFDGIDDYASGTIPASVFSGSFTIEFVVDDYTWTNSDYFVSIQANLFSISTLASGSRLRVGNNFGGLSYDVGSVGSKYLGKWRFVYDEAETGFARYSLFHDGRELTDGTQISSFADFAITTGATQLAARTSSSVYAECALSGFKVWSTAVYPGDSEASPQVSLGTIDGTTWTDTSGNSRNFTLNGGAVGLRQQEIQALYPLDNQVFQQDAVTTSIPVKIRYIGSPAAIQYRCDGLDWTTLPDTPTEGAGYLEWSIERDASPGNIEIRFSDRWSVTTTVENVLIGKLFLLGGDSNSEGRGTAAQSYTGAQPAYVLRQDNVWQVANDPFDTGTSIGSPFPLLATLLAASEATPIGFVTTGTGSQDIAGSRDEYAKGNVSYHIIDDQASLASDKFEAAFFSLGNNATVEPAATQAEYEAALSQFVSDVRADVQADLVFYVNLFGEAGDRAANGPVRLAVIAKYDDDTILPGANLLGQNYSDDGHPKTDAELAEAAARWWLGYKGYRGPKLVSATMASGGTTITLTFDQDLETTDSTYSAAAFTVTDNGVAKTVSSASRTGARTAGVVLSTAIGSATILVSFAKTDANHVGLTIPRAVLTSLPATINSVSTAAQPAEPFIDVAVTVV